MVCLRGCTCRQPAVGSFHAPAALQAVYAILRICVCACERTLNARRVVIVRANAATIAKVRHSTGGRGACGWTSPRSGSVPALRWSICRSVGAGYATSGYACYVPVRRRRHVADRLAVGSRRGLWRFSRLDRSVRVARLLARTDLPRSICRAPGVGSLVPGHDPDPRCRSLRRKPCFRLSGILVVPWGLHLFDRLAGGLLLFCRPL